MIAIEVCVKGNGYLGCGIRGMKRGSEAGEKLWKIRDREGVMKCWVARWGESSPKGLSSVRVAD